MPHMGRNKFESNLSVPEIIELRNEPPTDMFVGWPKRDSGASVQIYQVRAPFGALKEWVLVVSLDPWYSHTIQ